MPNPRKSLTGQTFGFWTITAYAGQIKPGSLSLWWGTCRCGEVRKLSYSNLVRGKSTSCGCSRLGKKRGPRKKKPCPDLAKPTP